jgi:hypothetical protein
MCLAPLSELQLTVSGGRGGGGFTYNLENPSTDYQNGVDFHLDWGASQFLSKQLLVGAVGYVYKEVAAAAAITWGASNPR